MSDFAADCLAFDLHDRKQTMTFFGDDTYERSLYDTLNHPRLACLFVTLMSVYQQTLPRLTDDLTTVVSCLDHNHETLQLDHLWKWVNLCAPERPCLTKDGASSSWAHQGKPLWSLALNVGPLAAAYKVHHSETSLSLSERTSWGCVYTEALVYLLEYCSHRTLSR